MKRKLKLRPEVVEAAWNARKAWKERQVQVLIDEDVPEDYEEVLDLAQVEAVVRSLDVPVRVVVQGTRYLVQLRQRVPRDQYLEVLDRLKTLDPEVHWDRDARSIVLLRSREIPEEERLDIAEIVIAPGEAKV